MGLIGTFGGYYLYRTIRYALGRNTGGIGIGTAVAAWTSVVVASIGLQYNWHCLEPYL